MTVGASRDWSARRTRRTAQHSGHAVGHEDAPALQTGRTEGYPPQLTRSLWLSIVTAVATIELKAGAYLVIGPSGRCPTPRARALVEAGPGPDGQAVAIVDTVFSARCTGNMRIGRMRAWSVPASALLGMFSAALYVYVLIEIVVGDVDRNVSFVSELSARDQPHHLLFQAFDATAGALIAVLGVGLGLVRRPVGQRAGAGWRWGCCCVVGFGLATGAVACLPLDCAASASLACGLKEQSGRVSLVHHAHSVASVLSTVAAIASVALLGWSSRGRPGWRPVAWAAAAAFPVVSVLSATLALLGLGWGLEDSETAGGHLRAVLGIGQRVELLVVAGWIGVLSACLLRAARVPTVADPGAEYLDGHVPDERGG